MLDIDGTLVDSQHAIVAAMDMACHGAGVVPPAPEQTRAIIGLSLPEAIAALMPDQDEPTQARLVDLYREAFLSIRVRPDFNEPLFPGVREALDRLDADGCLLGLATGKSRRGVLAMIERHGLEGRFVTLQTPDDGPGKPDPSMLRRALADTGAEAVDTVMVGDTTFDMRMARAAGTDALGVSWGYHPAEALTAAGARLVLPRAAALPDSLPWPPA
jgi:phosphoglycolate phosphatase